MFGPPPHSPSARTLARPWLPRPQGPEISEHVEKPGRSAGTPCPNPQLSLGPPTNHPKRSSEIKPLDPGSANAARTRPWWDPTVLSALGDVPLQMPGVSDLHCRGTGSRSLREGAGPVPIIRFHFRVAAKPRGQRLGVPAGAHRSGSGPRDQPREHLGEQSDDVIRKLARFSCRSGKSAWRFTPAVLPWPHERKARSLSGRAGEY